MEGRPQGTIAFLFSDIEGSTRLWEEQHHAMDQALVAHDHILREAIEAESGYVFSTQGDAFAAAFHSASDAARAALAIQHSLTHHSWPDDARIQVRIARGGPAHLAARPDGPAPGASFCLQQAQSPGLHF